MPLKEYWEKMLMLHALRISDAKHDPYKKGFKVPDEQYTCQISSALTRAVHTT